MRTGGQEIRGMILLGVATLMMLSLMSYRPGDISLLDTNPNSPPMNLIGSVGAWFGFVTFMCFGVAGYLFPLLIAGWGCYLIFSEDTLVSHKVLWMSVILLCLVCLVQVQPELWSGVADRLNIGHEGGQLGNWVSSRFLVKLLGIAGTGVLMGVLLVVSLLVLFEIQPVAVAKYFKEASTGLKARVQETIDERRDRSDQLDREERELEKRRRRLEQAVAKERKTVEKVKGRRKAKATPLILENEADSGTEAAEVAEPVPEPVKPKIRKSILPKSKPKPAPESKPQPKPPEEPEPKLIPEEAPALASGPSIFSQPSLKLLDAVPTRISTGSEEEMMATGRLIEETLAEFGIEVEVTNVHRGPVVTRYELLPPPGVKVEKISGLSNNIALAMKAESIRIQAPIPGKGVVGIEVPNEKSNMVYLREIMECDEWKAGKAALPLALGKDVSGRDLIADLAEMPHLLIAGATGAGKTVCMNSILAGLLMSRTPDQMRLMLVDPKIVEFAGFADLPHLVVPVITDPKKVQLGLRWAINEMEKRYKMFASVGVRNIKGFNSRPIEEQTDLFGEDENDSKKKDTPDRLPYIVVIVDELADLMMVAQAEIENSIARLAQLSRATGIHMILATQRPSVNVLTGTIKANFPARIAFQVAQKVDSRTILDAQGAEKTAGERGYAPQPTGKQSINQISRVFYAGS